MQLKKWEQHAKEELIKQCFGEDLPTEEQFKYLWELVLSENALVSDGSDLKDLLVKNIPQAVKKAIILFILNPRMMVRFFGVENLDPKRRFYKYSPEDRFFKNHVELISNYVTWFAWVLETYGNDLRTMLSPFKDVDLVNSFKRMNSNFLNYVTYVSRDQNHWGKIGLPNNPLFEVNTTDEEALDNWSTFFNNTNRYLDVDSILIVINSCLERFKNTPLCKDSIKTILYQTTVNERGSKPRNILVAVAKFTIENSKKDFSIHFNQIEDNFKELSSEAKITVIEACVLSEDFSGFSNTEIQSLCEELEKNSKFNLAAKLYSAWCNHIEATLKLQEESENKETRKNELIKLLESQTLTATP